MKQPMQHDPQGYDLVGNADFYVKDKILVELKHSRVPARSYDNYSYTLIV
jgi:hypothetical protein